MRKTNYTFLAAAVLAAVAVYTAGSGAPSVVDAETYRPAVYASAAAMLPPLLAIALALITKEVYSSLFAGIAAGALLYANGNIVLALNTMLFATDAGLVPKLSSGWNIGILIFLVVLGIIVALMNKSGASEAFGVWASRNIKSRVGAEFATIVLGILIFVDDYFNCLTVGSVMRPVTDRHKVSRAKLAYLIDATAAPVCIIAPISSWAAAVTSSVPQGVDINGFAMFLNTIPYNFYACTTILMMFMITAMRYDFGPMKLHEDNALRGDLFTAGKRPDAGGDSTHTERKGEVADMIVPVSILIVSCVTGMIYTGGYFSGASFADAFAAADASRGLVLGSMVTLLAVITFVVARGVLTFRECADSIPDGFKTMTAPILILCFAWTLSGMTGLLGGKFYIRGLIEGSAASLQMFLPAIIFIVAIVLSFSTGTSWGTFAILVPIVCSVFSVTDDYQMLVISISACLSGAVCGDHCSPISDTTIMASAGAGSDHVAHVTTQLPYAMTAAAVSAVGYVAAGYLGYSFPDIAVYISLPITLALMAAVLLAMGAKCRDRDGQ